MAPLRLVAPLVFVALVASRASATPAPAVATVGSSAPPFSLVALDGSPLDSSAFAGKPLYVNVFATWCPPCRSEMPLIARTLPRFAHRLAFLAVDSQESPSMVTPYLKSVGVRAEVAIDEGQFVASYGATSIPESIFIDRHGLVRAIVHGPISAVVLRRDLATIAR